jgi:hypothetical protein
MSFIFKHFNDIFVSISKIIITFGQLKTKEGAENPKNRVGRNI